MSHCKNCGHEFSSGSQFCPSCGTKVNDENIPIKNTEITSDAPYTEIDNHLTKAILVTLFCCVPLGIASIVKAASVNGKIQNGDYKGAREDSNKANNWANWSIGLGLITIIIYILIGLFSY